MKKTLFTILILALANVVVAQIDENSSGQKEGEKIVVGAIGGTVDVTALGGASYTIPIQVPEGINGMQPSLAINYNSQSGNGLLGWGWNLSGVSAITRVGQTLYHDGQTKGVDFNDDRFALDGQRLLLVNNQPYGGNGAEYRTEVDGMAKIVSYTCDTTNGPAKFKVWLPNGNIAYYGYKDNTRIGLRQRNDVCMWMLDSIVDRNGNYVAYRYHKGTTSCRLNRVLYTGNAHANLDPSFCIDFSYLDRTDVEISFIGNNYLRQVKLLTGIEVKDLSSSSFVLWKYDFNYDSSTEFGTPLCYNRLTSIDFLCDGKKYYPTIINWDKSELDSRLTSIIVDGINLHNAFDINNTFDPNTFNLSFVKFTGDFNGDGYTDVISSGNLHEAGTFHVYINLGKPDGDVVHFTDVASIERDENLDWIYVGDFNGDGLDDFMCVSRDRSWWYVDFVTLKPYLTRIDADGTIWFEECESPNNSDYWIGKRKELTLVMGDFLGNKRMSFIFQTHRESKRKHLYIYFKGEDPNGRTFAQKKVDDLNAECMRAADFNGDGITELWYYSASENDWFGKIVKLTPDYSFETINNTVLSRKDKVFIGDFNGDGHADFLTYYENDQTWKIWLCKLTDFYWQSYDITNLMPIGDPGDHGFSMFGYNGGYQAVEIADFNGDGKTDIAAIKKDGTVYDRLVILYAPFTSSGCAYTQEFGLYRYTDIQVSAQENICVGNFLGKENVSLFSRCSLFSLAPLTHRYGVSKITDGMGNHVSFEYKYLMPNKRNPSSSNFYQTTYNKPNLDGNGCFVVSLPIRGVNTMSTNEGGYIFKFANAIIHNKGKGFLGFETIWSTYSPPSVFWPKTVHKKQFSRAITGDHHSLLLDYDSCFIRLRNTTDPILSGVDSYTYDKKTNLRNNLVYMPLQVCQTSDKYDVYDDGQFLNRKIVRQFYEVDGYGVDDGCYLNTVHGKKTIEGTGLEFNDHDVDNAPFKSISEIVYEPENYSEWIVNRPYSTIAKNINVDDPSNSRTTITTCDYDNDNPYSVSRQTVYPGGRIDSADPFATYVENEYDEVGNVTYCTSGDLLGQLPVATTDNEYYPNYRQLKKQTNQAGYETSYTYDPRYGYCNSITDCKGLVTQYTKDPMGTIDQTIYPDGVITNYVTNWISNWDDMKPEYAKYYTLTHSSSGFDAKTYFDNKGRKLREVTYGFNGDPICVDTKYYSNRLVDKVSEPFFFSNIGNERYTNYHYDQFLRNDLTKFPDGTIIETAVVGFTTTTTRHPRPDSDLPSQVTSTAINKAGWTIESVDANGTSVHYEYYPDGQLKWTQIGEDETTRISLEYDNAGNRTLLVAPNYGKVTSIYNAYGQLRFNTDPKGNTTEYQYDNLGRNIVRIETDSESEEQETTSWIYDYSGNNRLDYIISPNQTIHYEYDALGRVRKTHDKRPNLDVKTTGYQYDDFSRIRKVTYPTGYTIRKTYNEYGYLSHIKDDDYHALWKTIDVNEFGQIKSFRLGSNIYGTRDFDESHRLQTTSTEVNGEIIQSFTYHYDDFSNLDARKDNKYGMEESFLYDDLNRLTTITLNGVESSMGYDSYGRLISKQVDGQMVFTGAKYETYDQGGNLKPHAISEATMPSNLFPTQGQSITYTMFDKVKTISQDNRTLVYDYGYDHQRIHMEERVGDEMVTTKDYYGNCEIIDNGTQIPHTYLSGPLGTFAVVRNVMGEDQVSFILKDHLGSWTAVTDSDGNLLQELSFDAWGNLRDPETWSGQFEASPLLDRGFTGHEHLYNFGLINMNGRMYDPVMSSFLSVDNYVQQPDNSQNFNRYAYCLNNPLKYTDPSGDDFLAVSMIVGAVVCAYLGGAAANGWDYNPCNWTWKGDTWAGLGIGAIVGAGAGAAFAYAAPGLASTAFMSHFGISGVVTSYSFMGFASLGLGGYVSGFSGGMLYSNGDRQYSHLSGLQGLKVGATIGAFAGQLVGGIATYEPPKEEESITITIHPEEKWDGCYFKGTNDEFQQMMVETSKYFGVETKGYSTSRGYYFEPIYGDVAYRVCNIGWDDLYYYKSAQDKAFRYSLDYNCQIMEGPFMNGFDYCYRYTKMYADRNGQLYIYPDGNYPAPVYAAYHAHPRNSYEDASDMENIFWMGVNGVIFGWNGCKHYYYPPW